MAKYLLLYRADASAAQQMAEQTPEAGQAEMEAWMAWAGRVGDAMVDLGSPCMSVASVGGGSTSDVAGYSLVEADSTDAATALLEGHPHLKMGTIDVLELLAIPGM